jgi:chemotaxis protein MotB
MTIALAMDERDDRPDRYLISYADMVTLLVGVFVVLSTTFRADAERYRQLARAASAVFGTRSTTSDTVQLSPLAAVLGRLSPANIEHDSTTYRCILADEVLFETGSSRLSERAEQALAELAEILRDGTAHITIDGHSDSRPPRSGQCNLELSVERAMAVAVQLVKGGVPEERIVVRGFGASHPIAPEPASPNNRRVEILIAFDN